MNYRFAKACDLPLLAQLNDELVRDEGADNPMTLTQLQERMRGWLNAQYRAVLFEEASTTAGYALFRSDEEGIHLRHFFIARSMRQLSYSTKRSRFCGLSSMEIEFAYPRAARRWTAFCENRTAPDILPRRS